MAYPTPPRTAVKTTKFKNGMFKSAKTPKPIFYEDVYGICDSDEEVEGGVDVCESDCDSDDEGAFSKSPEYQRLFGAYAGQAAEVQQGKPDGDSGLAEDSRAKVTTPENTGKRAQPAYRIAPNTDRRQSVRVQKLSVTKQYGMFELASSEASNITRRDGSAEKQQQSPESTSEHDQPVLVDKTANTPFRAQKQGVGLRARPTTRQLLSQQLQEQDKSKEVAKRDARRGMTEKPNKQAARREVRQAGKARKETTRSVRNVAMGKATVATKAHEREAFVSLGGDDIDRDEYQQYD